MAVLTITVLTIPFGPDALQAPGFFFGSPVRYSLPMPGVLYLVATPIGNLQDITYRAVETLHRVDLIACEDTRHTRKLLTHYRISNRTVSYHEHNERERAEELLDRLAAGESVAVVTDAGTPGIADPGFRIAERAAASGIDVVAVPGATAFVAAAVVSGLPTDSIFFGGFLPSKKGERRRRLEEIADIPATIVFYETPHRIERALADCLEILGDRPAAMARELTKLHEEVIRGDLSEIAAASAADPPRGEIVLVIGRGTQVSKPSGEATAAELFAELTSAGAERKAAIKQVAKMLGIPKAEAYRRISYTADSE